MSGESEEWKVRMVLRTSWGLAGELDVGGVWFAMKITCGFVLCGGVGGGPADRPT